jgi:hypothetical protein
MRNAIDMTLEEFKLELQWLRHQVLDIEPFKATRENARNTRTYINAARGKKLSPFRYVSWATVDSVKSRM